MYNNLLCVRTEISLFCHFKDSSCSLQISGVTVEHFRFRRRSIRGSLKEGSVPALVAADFTNIHPTLTGTNGLNFDGVLQNPAPDHTESAAISEISNRFVYS